MRRHFRWHMVVAPLPLVLAVAVDLTRNVQHFLPFLR